MIRIVALVVLLILFLLKWIVGINFLRKNKTDGLTNLKYFVLFTILIDCIFVIGNLVFNCN